jgi:hypothetical protein
MDRDLDPASPLKAPPISPDVSRPSQVLCSQQCFYRIDRRDISLLRFILEAYEGVATLSTVDPAEGVVRIAMAPGYEGLVREVLEALVARGDIRLEPLPAPPSAGQGDE